VGQNVGFIGLGVMGYPMAGHLSTAGHNVTVYNRTTSKTQQWLQEYQGTIAPSPAEVAKNADIIFVCVGNDNALRSVMLGENGVAFGLVPGKIVADHTTASADIARELDKAYTDMGVAFLDAPVSGGQAGAEKGQLTIMLGGKAEDYARVEGVMDAYAKFSQLLGPAGSGQLAKMMNQICIAGVVQGLAEALHFGQNAGLDCEAVVEVISKGAAQSWQMENRYQNMLKDQYDFGFAVDWMRKDLHIALDEARKNGSTLPLTSLVDQFYAQVQKAGGGRWDTSSLLSRMS
jgi:3-hydroxyisobutyrate dehydrogenase-like beta-hydroxyacid dehydrogenase